MSKDAEMSDPLTPLSQRIAALDGPHRGVDGLLNLALEALSHYACHAGPSKPCLRRQHQCAAECGKIAGDAYEVIAAAMETRQP